MELLHEPCYNSAEYMISVAIIEQWIVSLSAQVPLPAYVFFGEVIEEIISPIPSQVVLGSSGSIAYLQGWPLISLIVLAFIASIAKSVTTLIFYYIADKLEDRLVPMIGKYVGITHEDLERIGKKFDRGGKKEFLSIFVLRCMPIVPSAPLSLVCGLFKVNMRTFFWATVAGNWLRGSMILLTGYLGFDVLQSLLHGALDVKVLIMSAVVLALIGVIAWGYWQRYKTPGNT